MSTTIRIALELKTGKTLPSMGFLLQARKEARRKGVVGPETILSPMFSFLPLSGPFSNPDRRFPKVPGLHRHLLDPVVGNASKILSGTTSTCPALFLI